MEALKVEIEQVVEDSIDSVRLENIKCNFKKIPGKTYYLYQDQNGDLFFSLLNPGEWKSKNIFKGEYYYDYDLTLHLRNG